MSNQWVIQFDYSDPVMPSLVGPFARRDMAEKWIASWTFKEASWNIAPLVSPVTIMLLDDVPTITVNMEDPSATVWDRHD